MLKKLSFILIVGSTLILDLCGKNHNRSSYNERLELLRLKADTARIYCRDNGFNTDFCLLVDMRIHSGKKRMFLWDFKRDTISHASLCAHGYGRESTSFTPKFSNVPGSYCTSLGKYKIGVRAWSNWGIHIHYKLHGLESTNDNAFKRIIVLHSFDRIPEEEIHPGHIPMGFSQGCPVVDNTTMRQLDTLLQKQTKPTLLWIYF